MIREGSNSMEDKIVLYRYTATADHEPENIYHYAQEHGAFEPIWTYNDILEALRVLPAFESTCINAGDKYLITCYALESEA